jgi:hypothetical protein
MNQLTSKLHFKLKKVLAQMPMTMETNTYISVKEVKLEKLEGIGPLKAFPCSLLHHHVIQHHV